MKSGGACLYRLNPAHRIFRFSVLNIRDGIKEFLSHGSNVSIAHVDHPVFVFEFANYAASLYAGEEAHKNGYTQVLWLDGVEQKYIEEVGSMNIFFVIDNEVITPMLNGSILPGVTRDSVIRIVKDWGLKMTERSLAIDEVIDAANNGRLKDRV